MSKRGNGEGSLYQRPNGRWTAAITVDRRRRYFYAKTRKEAADKLAQATEAVRTNSLTEPTRLTVAAFLERWLEETAKPRVRPLTYRSYRGNVGHVTSVLGPIRLNKLTPLQVQHLINVKLKEGLNGKTVAYIRQVLRTALQDAVRWNLVPRNVVDAVPAPRKEHVEIRPLEPHEIGPFLAAASSRRLSALYVTALGLGLRQG